MWKWMLAILCALGVTPDVAGAARTATAQGGTPQAGMTAPRIELVILGSGGPRMTGRAASSNAIVVNGKARMLVDVGTGAAVRLGETGLDISDLDTMLLTHLHIDHSADLPSVAKARGMIHRGPMTFRVFGPEARGLFPGTRNFVSRIFDHEGIYAYQKTFGAPERFIVAELSIDLGAPEREVLREGDIRVTAIATNHGEAPSVAYRIDAPGTSLAFSGDVDPSALPNLTRLAKGVDLLVFNCAVLDPPGSPADLYGRHTPPKRIGEVAHDAGARRLVLTHIAPIVEKGLAGAIASVKTSFAGPVEVAADRMRIPLH